MLHEAITLADIRLDIFGRLYVSMIFLISIVPTYIWILFLQN